MATIGTGTVDVFVISAAPPATSGSAFDPSRWRFLALRRAEGTRCTGAWETVHGRVEAGEEPEDAALREVREETGLEVERLYALDVSPFYLPKLKRVELAVGFIAVVATGAAVTTGEEHDASEWLTADEARERYVWPRERRAVGDVERLLATGDAGPVEDVTRIR